jgi:3-methyladenine DNA glycosylase AlkD
MNGRTVKEEGTERPKDVERRVRARLARVASPEVKRQFETYFKGALPFVGVRRPLVAAAERELRPSFAALTAECRLACGMHLLRCDEMELRQVGIGVVQREVKRLPDGFIDDVAELFDEVVRDWATCDTICGKILRPLIVRSNANAKRVASWAASKNLWRRRAAAVAFVNEAKRGKHDDIILAVCRRLETDPERFVQLGCGWVVRELFLASPSKAVAFLEANMNAISSEGLRYAVEKMPTPKQRALLGKRQAASLQRRKRS